MKLVVKKRGRLENEESMLPDFDIPEAPEFFKSGETNPRKRSIMIKPRPVIIKKGYASAQAQAGGVVAAQGVPVQAVGGISMSMLRQLLSEKQHKKPRKIKFEGMDVPRINIDLRLPKFEEEKLKYVSTKYPLIPRNPKSKIYTYAHIYWDEIRHEFVYEVVEPEITKEDKQVLKRIKDFIEEKINIDFSKLRKRESIEYIKDMFDDAISYFRVIRSEEVKDILRYYIFRDFIGLEKIEPFLHDPYLEDISCDGINIPLYVYHKDSRFGSLRTNIFFRERDELDNFVTKLSERCGKSLSIANPLLDGTLPEGSRVQATLESDIARRGSNFTIRKFSEKPITPVDLLKYGTLDMTTLIYCWLAIEHGASILVSGGTASGKTSLLNVLSFFIKPQLKIVSIEDTSEIKIAHPHWISQVARVPIATSKKDIDLYELLRESLRQRPDYIIVGEVRGKEAYVLFQQIALGHGGLATIHAENFPKLVDRLTTAPISLPPSLLRNIDFILFVKRFRQREKYLRRISSLTEIVEYDKSARMPVSNELVSWDALKDEFVIKNQSIMLKKIATTSGLSHAEIKKEFEDRSKVLCWLIKRKIEDYQKITSVINLFYSSREYLLEKVSEEV